MTYVYTKPFYPQKTGSSRRTREQYLARSFRSTYQVSKESFARSFIKKAFFQPPNRIIALGCDTDIIEVFETDVPSENVVAFESQPERHSKWKVFALFVYKYGVFVFWLGILFIMVLALGSAATSHNELRYDCDCFNLTDFCQNCSNGSWFQVPLGTD